MKHPLLAIPLLCTAIAVLALSLLLANTHTIETPLGIALLIAAWLWSRNANRHAREAETAIAAEQPVIEEPSKERRVAFVHQRRNAAAVEEWHSPIGRLRRAIDYLLAPVAWPIEWAIGPFLRRLDRMSAAPRAAGGMNTMAVGAVVAIVAHVVVQGAIHVIAMQQAQQQRRPFIVPPVVFISLTQMLYLIPLQWGCAATGRMRTARGIALVMALTALLQGGLCMAGG